MPSLWLSFWRILFLLFSLFSSLAFAAPFCPLYPLAETPIFQEIPPASFAAEAKGLRLRADRLESEEGLWRWQGAVRLDYGDYKLYSERLKAYPNDRVLRLPLPFIMESSDYILTGTSGTWDFQKESGNLIEVEARLRQRPGRLGGESLSGLGEKFTLKQAFYTTCPDRSWLLKAQRLEVDRAQGFATAKNVRFFFKDVPLLYWPRWTFPIDNRRLSGFLLPSISNAQRTGLTIKLPYYLNLAANRDATLSLNLFSRRGVQLASEFRHLNALGNNQSYTLQGTLSLALLNDRLINGDNRRFWAIKETLRPSVVPVWQLGTKNSGFWQMDLEFQEASDKNYLLDLEEGFNLVNQPYLAKNFLLKRQMATWSWSLASGFFQALDTQNEFALAPQLRLARQRPWALPGGFFISGQAESSRFQDPDRRLGVAGARQVLEVELQRPLAWAGFWWQPALNLQWRRYDVEQKKSVFYQEISGEVQLSRILQSRASRVLQLQVAYFYQPQVAPSPANFDSGLQHLNYYQLFRANSFSGYDQQSQGQRLVLGLEQSQGQGDRRFLWRVAQSLPWDHQAFNKNDFLYKDSLFFAEIRGQSQNLWWQAEWAVDNARFRLVQNLLRVHWQAEDSRKRLHFNYRYQRDNAAQADLGGQWPLAGRWQAQAYVSSSFEEKRLLEGQIGLIYESCCWIFRLGNTAFYVQSRDRYENVLGIQLEFKGFASIGSRDSSLYPKEIYDDFFLSNAP